MSLAGDMLRTGYRAAVGAATLAVLPLARRGGPARVFYGGARPGASGGPLVKVSLLQRRYPEHRLGFSLAYLLSNALYLPDVALDAVMARGVPIVVNQNGVFYPAWYPRGFERENARMAAAQARAAHVFYQSAFCRRCALRFLGVDPASWEILPNGVDIRAFTPAMAPRAPGPFRLLLTGKLGPSTGYRLSNSLEALAEARRGGLEVELLVAGEVAPSVQADAEGLIDRLGLAAAVRLLGPFSRGQAPDLYRGADAYLITKHNDPCPNVVLEALASGLPVLYAASGGIPELVGEAAGVGIPVEESFERVAVPDPRALAEGLAAIMAGRAAMAAAARHRAEQHFALEGWFARHDAVFSRLTSRT